MDGFDYPFGDVPARARDLVLAERKRQVDEEGWSLEHDRKHGAQILTKAAHCYEQGDPKAWPWTLSYWKPSTLFRNYVKAGALYLAAYDVERAELEEFNSQYQASVTIGSTSYAALPGRASSASINGARRVIRNLDVLIESVLSCEAVVKDLQAAAWMVGYIAADNGKSEDTNPYC